jgi:type III secretory pathway component EscS
MYEWLEGLKRIMMIIVAVAVSIIVGIIFFLLSAAVAGFVAGVGNSILKALNETGFTIPASVDYVAPIESLASSALLMLRTASRPPVFIGIILAVVGILVALLKRYDGLSV